MKSVLKDLDESHHDYSCDSWHYRYLYLFLITKSLYGHRIAQVVLKFYPHNCRQ